MELERLKKIRVCIEEWIEELNTWEGPHDLYHFLVKHGFRAEAVLEPIITLFKMIIDENQEFQQYKCEMEIQIIDFHKQLIEAQQTIRMAYSDLPDKKYDAEATLGGYMTRHNLEEW